MTRAFFVAVALLVSLSARAQTPTDATKVDKSKPQEAAAAPTPPTPDFTQSAQAAFNFLYNDGNTSALAGRLDGFYQAKYLVNGFRVDVSAGMAEVAQDPDADPSNGFGVGLFNADNRANTVALVKLRYDYFLTDDDSIYASGLVQHDSAANLLVRFRADVGYRHFLFNFPKHSLAGEIGAVYTIDDAPVGTDDNGDGLVDIRDQTQFEKTGTIGARIALAYTNALSDAVQYTGTVEVIPNIFPDVDAPFESARLGKGDNKLGLGEATTFAMTNALTANINASLAFGVNLTLLYDLGAVARRNAYTNHDVALAATLTYKLF